MKRWKISLPAVLGTFLMIWLYPVFPEKFRASCVLTALILGVIALAAGITDFVYFIER